MAVSVDINDDKLPDVYIGARVVYSKFPEIPSGRLLLNKGNGNFEDVSDKYPAITQAGMVSDAVWADLDQDGRSELLLTGNWMSMKVFNFDKGGAQEVTSRIFQDQWPGLWNCLLVEDLDQDGKMEIVAGNWGLNSQFKVCLLYTSPSPRDRQKSRMPSSA